MTEAEIDHCEYWVMVHFRVKESGKPNVEEERIQVNERWNFEYLEEKLKDYKDKQVIEYFKYRWPLNAEGTETRMEIPPNQAGARGDRAEV